MKIVKIKLSKNKSVLAAEVKPNKYVSVEGIKYTNPSPEYIEEASDSEISKELKEAFYNLQYAYEEWMELEKKQAELSSKKIKVQKVIYEAETFESRFTNCRFCRSFLFSFTKRAERTDV